MLQTTTVATAMTIRVSATSTPVTATAIKDVVTEPTQSAAAPIDTTFEIVAAQEVKIANAGKTY